MKRILCLLSALLFLLLPAAGCARDNTVKAEIADAGLPLSDMKAPPSPIQGSFSSCSAIH